MCNCRNCDNLRRRVIYRYVLIILLFFSFFIKAETDKIKVIFEHNPPFQVSDDKGGGTGPVIDFAKILLEQAGIDAEFILLPWARIIQKETFLPNNIILSISKTAKRKNSYLWLTKVYSSQQYIWQRTKMPYNLTGLVGVERNSYKVPYLKDHFGNKNVVEFLDTDQAVVAMIKGNIDYYVGSTIALKKKLERRGIDFSGVMVKQKFDFENHDGLHIALTLGTPQHIVNRLSAALSNTQVRDALVLMADGFASQDKPFLAKATQD